MNYNYPNQIESFVGEGNSMTYKKLCLIFKGILLWFTILWTGYVLCSVDYFLEFDHLLLFALLTVGGCILCCVLTINFKEFILLSGYKLFYKLFHIKKA